MRFLCDEMLGDLARYLRAAGHDTVLARGGAPDTHWIAVARRQRRLFLTRDRLLAPEAGEDVALQVPDGDLDAAAAFLRQALELDWLYRPFSRCLLDNAELTPVPAQAHRRVPPDIPVAEARACPSCGRVYWPGSHYRRMRARLAGWAGR
ncbi:MAG: hypothetical protein JSW68_02455 [Burkholderiales bacterium]|nr:MAG: hypothetical protein JSW68_02455 [Burkholderiales bacterium]